MSGQQLEGPYPRPHTYRSSITMSRAQYAVVRPVTPKGKWVIVSRRIGPSDRFAPIAECTSEVVAEQITAALNGQHALVFAQAAE